MTFSCCFLQSLKRAEYRLWADRFVVVCLLQWVSFVQRGYISSGVVPPGAWVPFPLSPSLCCPPGCALAPLFTLRCGQGGHDQVASAAPLHSRATLSHPELAQIPALVQQPQWEWWLYLGDASDSTAESGVVARDHRAVHQRVGEFRGFWEVVFFVTRGFISGACSSKRQNSKSRVGSSADFCMIYLSFILFVSF